MVHGDGNLITPHGKLVETKTAPVFVAFQNKISGGVTF
jgi:hypothetical protein